MTTPEFLHALAEIAGDFDWRLVPDLGEHADRRSKLRFHIRAMPAGNPALKLAPLQALCYSETRQVLQADDWTEAAEALRLPIQEAAEIVAAASDRTWTGTEGNRTPSERLVGLRRSLLETVGLIAPVPVG